MKIGQLVNKVPAAKTHKKSDKLIDSETLLGVEVEVENCTKYYNANCQEASYWTHKEDLSLRNNGREFVFAEPLFGYDAVRAVEFLCKQAKDLNWKISNLCGIHTHVDVREMDTEELRNLCVTWCLVEPLVYNWVGDKRDRNIFCLPWNVAEEDLRMISEVIKNPDSIPKDYVIDYIKKFHKYSGLNLQSLATFGTAEFRMLKTTFDSERIITWLNLLLSVKKYSKQEGLKAEDVIHRLRYRGAIQFAKDVFGHLLPKVWYDDYRLDVVGICGPIAEWFVKSPKDILLKSKGKSGAFEWIRDQRLKCQDQDQVGQHQGHQRWVDKNGKPQGKKKVAEKYVIKPGLLYEWNVVHATADAPDGPVLFVQEEP